MPDSNHPNTAKGPPAAAGGPFVNKLIYRQAVIALLPVAQI